MGASRKRMYYGGVLACGLCALIVDRTLFSPGAASAAPPQTSNPPASEAPERAAPAPTPLPEASVPGLAMRLERLDPTAITNDIFHADPDEWALRAPGTPAEPLELRLGAIIDPHVDRGAGACALINARIRRVGDSVAGYTVETISATSVTLRREGETRVLRVERPGGAEAP